jgi:hypothetical protein
MDIILGVQYGHGLRVALALLGNEYDSELEPESSQIDHLSAGFHWGRSPFAIVRWVDVVFDNQKPTSRIFTDFVLVPELFLKYRNYGPHISGIQIWRLRFDRRFVLSGYKRWLFALFYPPFSKLYF